MATSLRAQRRQTQLSQIQEKILSQMTSKATTLIIIRHGETDWNLNNRIQGQLDPPLNNLGVQQAKAVVDRIDQWSAQIGKLLNQNNKQQNGFVNQELNLARCKIFSSDLLRTKQTAELFGDLGRLSFVSGLRERHLGNLQGYTRAEAKINDPESWRALQSFDIQETIPGGGESRFQFQTRVTSTIQQLADENEGQTIVVITHGGPLGIIYQHVTGQHLNGVNLNCAINCIQIEGEKRAILCWGYVEHLQNVGVDVRGIGGNVTGL
eukprot:TRINITY_DN11566_c0_g3_i1.p1 TRINITY_DN11566_c0_g3~~TRINITY_DN11566_c0_g3_i1.p1  ORF type:complete len:266 (-),score=32.82 TRINITY_DN11566_c0_g3_i1:74-871(-)